MTYCLLYFAELHEEKMALGEETWRREASWQDTFNQLRSCHDQAYRKIDEALQFDEEGQHNKVSWPPSVNSTIKHEKPLNWVYTYSFIAQKD